MNKENLMDDFYKEIMSKYVSKRPASEKLFKKACEYLPGGDTRRATFYHPFPAFMERGEGCFLYDVDGHKYLDYLNNYCSLVHGHAHPKVVAAITEQAKIGTVFGAPAKANIDLAREICHRLPSAEKVRFCNSGTEATIAAIRLARSYRKKYKIVKMEGGYHGAHDLMEVSIDPMHGGIGPIERPNSVPEDESVPPSVVKDCIIAPYNNSDASVRIIEDNHNDLAAVIVEPMQGGAGMIPAEHNYLGALRDVTKKYDIPLIFDEILTFRLATGGCQELWGISPDMTALGKIIGGGTAIGAIAGSEKYLNLFSPLNPSSMSHSGTFNGNPLAMVAGLATLKELTASEISRINELGNKLRAGIEKVSKEVGVNVKVTGTGSLMQIHFTDQEVRDWRSSTLTERLDIKSIFHIMLLDKGIFMAPRGMFIISTPMGQKQVDDAIFEFKKCLIEMKPLIESEAPELLDH
jgi:glutamate-1-semialdehyde 2,1-aminomutase